MKTYKCTLSFEDEVQAEDINEAKEKWIDMICNLSSGWEMDNTTIEELDNLHTTYKGHVIAK